MKTLSLDEIKSVSLDGLIYFRDYVEKHQLRYFLSWGTLLGAVRHQGFIPWDDDIDIWMPRKDYNILMSQISEFENEDWSIINNSRNHRYLLAWAKIVNKKTICKPSVVASGFCPGLTLDIFPLDYIDKTIEEAEIEMINMTSPLFKQLEGFHPSVVDINASLYKRIIRFLYFYFKNIINQPYHELLSKYDNLFINNKDSSQSVVDYISTGRVVFNRDWFGDGKVLYFENERFIGPENADKVLTALYGDYRTLPPMEERITHHLYDTFYI